MLRIASWGFFALLALLWTGGALLVAELAQWSAQALASGTLAEAGRELATRPLPQGVAIWIDPAWADAMRSLVVWALDAGSDLLPLAGAAAGWLVPLVWIFWGLGMLLLLALAVGAHLVLRRFARKPLAHQVP